MKQTLGLFLVLFWSLTAFGQEINVTGLVTDVMDGSPIPGVSVQIKGTTNGTITNIDGVYQLKANTGDILIFSFIGMETVEMAATSAQMDVTLKSEVTDLDAVVVVGYGVQKKKLTVGANQNVKGEAITALSTSTAMEALQGIAPGVSITRDNGQPSASTKVVIRGMGTIGNSKPLYIIDGVASENIDFLSPNDIEAIDVLKDAASAAIYGSRAANGVILVTTKKGTKNRPATITYDGYYGVQNVYKTPSTLNAQEYMYIMDEGRVMDGLPANDWQARLSNNNWLDTTYPNNLGSQYGEDIWTNLQNGWEGTNWIDEMTTKNAPVKSHSVNVTGGSEDIIYTFGASYLDQQGIVGGDLVDAGMKRFTARLNTEFILKKVGDRSIIKVGENLSYTNNVNRDVATGGIYYNDLHNALVQNPLMPVYWDKSPDKYGFAPNLQDAAPDQNNPIATMFYGRNFNWNRGNKVIGNVYAEIQPIENLVFRTSYGIESWFGDGRSWTPTYALGLKNGSSIDGAQQTQYFGYNWTWTNTLSYNRKFGDHKVDGMIGQEMFANAINTNVGGNMTNTKFQDPEYAYLDNAQKTTIGAINTWGRDNAAQGGGLLSYMARAQYNYKEKYILSATLRADGSSNFAEGNRWGYFPSVAAGWVITQEEFMASSANIMDFAKIRASWGQNGNQSIQNFVYSSTMKYLMSTGYYFGDTKPIPGNTAIPARVPNPDVTWETSEQLNIGFDTRFLTSKLGLTFDWYQKKTLDWLVEDRVPGTAGAGAPIINGGNVKNSGVEVTLTWNDNVGKFKYGATLSGSHNENEVTKIANANGIINGQENLLSQSTASATRCEVGKPIGYFYGYQTAGILQNQAEVNAYTKPDGTLMFTDQRPGDVRFVDQNSDGQIDEKDKVMIGSPHPDFELGLQLNAEYAGVYANATLTGKFGMQVMQSYRSFADKFDQNYTTEIFDRWYGEGTSNRYPRLSSASHRNTNYISDIYVHDADYLRISNITIGYKLMNIIPKSNWLADAKIYVSFKNLYTFTNYSGMDPEVSFGGDQGWASGIDLGLYPQPRTVLMGVSLAF